MTEARKNIAVGMTVIVALAIFSAMILLFAGVPEWFQRGYELRILTDATYNIRPGDSINLSGAQVGRITSVQFTDGDARKGVTIIARVSKDVLIPGNVVVLIFGGGSFGTGSVMLKPEGPEQIDPATGEIIQFLPTDRPTTLQAKVVSSGGLFPAEVTDAIKGLAKLADNLNNMIAPPPEPAPSPAPSTATGPSTQTATGPAGPQEDLRGLQGTMVRVNRTLDAMYAVLGDVDNQRNIKVSMANLAKAAASAIDAMEAIKALANKGTAIADEGAQAIRSVNNLTTQASTDLRALTNKLIDDADKISMLMMTLNKVAMKLDAGEGTAGKLFNDPALYQSLLEMTKEMNTLIKDFDALTKQWKERGVEIKVK